MEFTGERFVPLIEGEIKYEHLHRYALGLEFATGKSVLDIASGEGYGTAFLARVARSAIGVDLDPASIAHAKHSYYLSNLNFLVGSADALPLLDASVDLVTSFETIEHHDLHEEMLLEIKRVLKPGGTLIISSPNRLTYSDERNYINPFHIKELYYDEFYELLGRHFKHLRLYGQRLATSSFIFPLQGSSTHALRAYTGDPEHLSQEMSSLSSPLYFVAICSDAALSEQQTISSLYIDAKDDLLKQAEGEKLGLFEQLQKTRDAASEQQQSYEAQIEHITDELARARLGYEEQIGRMARELSNARACYEAQLEQLTNELSAVRVKYEEQLKIQTDELSHARAQFVEYQAQVGQQTEELAHARAGYQEQIDRMTRELDDARAGYEAQLERLTNELSCAHAQLSELEAQVTSFQTQLEQHAISYSEAQMQLAQRNSALVETHAQLLKQDEVLNWMQTSRSWQVAASLRHLSQLPYRWRTSLNRLLSRLNLPTPSMFKGVIESPLEGAHCSKYLDVSGWVASTTSRVTLVEVFFDDFFLGTVHCSTERPDIAAAFPAHAGKIYGFAERLTLQSSFVGRKTLTIRTFDQNGHQQMFTRSITITPAGESVQDMIAPTSVEIASAPVTNDAKSHTSIEFVKSGEIIEAGFCAHLEELIGEFQNRMKRAPFILNWNTGLKLSEAFPHLAIMSPCALNGNQNLPYLDHTIDIVILSSENDEDMAEARRVAAAMVVQVDGLQSGEGSQLANTTEKSRLKLKAEWHDDEIREAPLVETSIIIPVYNKVAYTQNCLAQLQNTLPPNFRGEIIIIDDASTDETPTVINDFARQDERIKVLRNEQNRGFIWNCNRGAEVATGEVLVFLNNDTLPQQGWLPPLLKVLQDYPAAGAVGGKLIYPDGTLQEAGGIIFSDASGCNFGKHDKAASAPLYSYLREVDYCSGALLATSRELFIKLGGFDMRFAPAYYEDTDYCFSLREKGYRVYYQPEAVIIHFEGVSSGTDINNGVKKYQAVNRTKFLAKWKHVLQLHPAPPDQYDFTTLHALSVRSWP